VGEERCYTVRSVCSASTSSLLPGFCIVLVLLYVLHRSLLQDSDSDRENNSSNSGTPSRKRRRGGKDSTNDTPSGPNKRSRSRSLTPPPQLTESERLRARLAIQHVLKKNDPNVDMQPVQPSTIILDDDDNDDGGEQELDPTLRKIAEKLKKKGHTGRLATEQDSPTHSSSGPSQVAARVQWVFHPEDESTQGVAPESYTFTVNRVGHRGNNYAHWGYLLMWHIE